MEDTFFTDGPLDFSDSNFDGENEFSSSSSKMHLAKEKSNIKRISYVQSLMVGGKRGTLKPNSSRDDW